MVALKQVREAAHLPDSTPLHADMYVNGTPRRLTAIVPLDVGVTLREAIQLEEYVIEHAAVSAAQISFSIGMASIRDFALACARFGYRTFYCTFDTVLATRDGIHQGPPIGFRATTVFEASDVTTYLDEALRDAARVYDERYATSLIGVPRATVRCCLRRGQYVRAGHDVQLPHELVPRKKGFAQLKSVPDGFCFKYALLYHCAKRDKFPAAHHDRRAVLDRYAAAHEEAHGAPPLDFGALEAKMAAGGIDVREHAAALTRFENVNKVSLCIWQWDGQESIACRARACKTSFPEVCLLQVEARGRWHFYYCTNPVYFLMPLKEPVHENGHMRIGCGRCGAWYKDRSRFGKHEARCRAMQKAQHEDFLPSEQKICFTRAPEELRAPVCIYADFEAINVDDDCLADNCKKQVGVSWGLYVITEFASVHHRTYHSHVDAEETEGEAALKFVETLLALKKKLWQEHKKAKDAHATFAHGWSAAQREAYEDAEVCERCGDAFEEGEKVKVLHHCHLTGDYLGALCSSCNTSLPVPKFCARVFFHNLNYDLANVLHALASPLPDPGVNCEWGFACVGGQINDLKDFQITRTRTYTNAAGKETQTTDIDVQFIDSFAHLSCGLEGLLRTLPRAQMHHLRHGFGSAFDATTPQGAPIVGGKSLFPYDHFTTVAQLEGPIPAREHFYSQLAQSAPSDAEWAHFEASNAALGLATFRAMHDFYLKVDVLGLADVFENYRRVAREAYALDPAYSLTAPAYSWKAMLRMTKVEFDGVPDAETMDFLEAGKRGGVSCAVTRHVKANYPDDPSYDAALGPKSLVYLDANNLYGKAMSYALPTGGMRWIDPSEFEATHHRNATIDYEVAGTGYFFEVDLQYPEHLHDAHAAMPLAPVKRAVREEELTARARQIWEAEKQTHALALSNEKLLTTLEDKERYVVWGSTLRLYVALGLVVTKTHRILACAMSPFLKPYIDANTAKRNEAKAAGDGAKSDFYKLMNNAVFGKTMENVRERGLFHVFREGDGERFTKVTSHPHFRRTVFDTDGLTITESDKRVVKFDKPLYVGVAILDVSKEWMYRCFYEHVHKAYGEGVQLVFTDTDSLCLAIDGDWYADVRAPGAKGDLLRDVMDFSGYAPEALADGNPHKGRLGYLKDECAPHRLLEAFALRAKMHAELLGRADGSTEWHQKCKGVPKSYVKRAMTRDHWLDVLKDVGDRAYEHRLAFNQIRSAARHETSAHFNVFEANKKKRTLSFYDDKRAILDDGLTTLPYGHKRLRTVG